MAELKVGALNTLVWGGEAKLPEEDLHARPAVTYEQRADLLYELLGVMVRKATLIRARGPGS
jgi:hypothetical protein